MPVVGQTRVLPQLLPDTRALLARAWSRSAGARDRLGCGSPRGCSSWSCCPAARARARPGSLRGSAAPPPGWSCCPRSRGCPRTTGSPRWCRWPAGGQHAGSSSRPCRSARCSPPGRASRWCSCRRGPVAWLVGAVTACCSCRCRCCGCRGSRCSSSWGCSARCPAGRTRAGGHHAVHGAAGLPRLPAGAARAVGGGPARGRRGADSPGGGSGCRRCGRRRRRSRRSRSCSPGATTSTRCCTGRARRATRSRWASAAGHGRQRAAAGAVRRGRRARAARGARAARVQRPLLGDSGTGRR